MANYKGHIIGAGALATVYVAVLQFVPVQQFVEAAGVLQDWQAFIGVYVVAVLMGLFPDIDTNSKGQNIFFGIALATDILLIWSGNIQAAAYLGLIAMLPIVGKHRGWTHSKWAMLVVPLPILIVPYLYSQTVLPTSIVFYSAAVIGYFSHLLLDGLIIRKIRIRT
jgi:membrane-bound metal-dependent hydrolase YbcI (DUF457 family)